MASSLYRFRVDSTNLLAKVRALEDQFREANGAIKAVNERSIEWLGQRAAENLAPHIRRARDFRNPETLMSMVIKREASVVTVDEFRFLDHRKVTALGIRASKYYRAIEFGSDIWVGKTLDVRFGLLFYGPGGERGQAGVGSWVNARFPQVHILNPVPAYHYASEASEAFVQSRLWWRWAYAALRAKGIENIRAR